MIKWEPSPARAGARTGALLGSACRPVVVAAFFLIHESRLDAWLTVIPASCLIGLLLGWILGSSAGSYGSIRRPWIGPLVGFLMGAVLWCASSVVSLGCLCIVAEHSVRASTPNFPLYSLIMTLVGAFAGLCSGLAANRVRRKLADPGREGPPA